MKETLEINVKYEDVSDDILDEEFADDEDIETWAKRNGINFKLLNINNKG